ncbi:unnamed protein product [Camellia sinensis]
MENYSYASSYPDSGDASPPSRDIDFDTTQPWEDQPPPAAGTYIAKFMCSFGGKIHPRPHDNQLSYIGGDTKILAVDCNIKFSGLIAKLSALCDGDVCLKYQLPGVDLDALISVTDDDDLEHMMHEYDRLYKASPKPARLRLFLFPANLPVVAAPSEEKTDRENFVDALNSRPIQSSPPPPAEAATTTTNKMDFLFGLDKGMPPPPSPVLTKVPDRALEPEVPAPIPNDRVIRADQIQDLQRLQIGGPGDQDQAIYRRRSDDNSVDYSYVQKFSENVQPPPATSPATESSPVGYWPENQISGDVYPATTRGPEQSVYMIQAPTGVYHTQMGRPVTGPTGQGYYMVQRMPQQYYRDQQPAYNVVPPVAAPAVAQPTLPPMGAGFSERYGMVRPTTGGGVGMVDAGYTQMAYDTGVGRQVYYTAAAASGGGVVGPPYQGMGTAAVSADMRTGQDGKVAVNAASQAPV